MLIDWLRCQIRVETIISHLIPNLVHNKVSNLFYKLLFDWLNWMLVAWYFKFYCHASWDRSANFIGNVVNLVQRDAQAAYDNIKRAIQANEDDGKWTDFIIPDLVEVTYLPEAFWMFMVMTLTSLMFTSPWQIFPTSWQQNCFWIPDRFFVNTIPDHV